MPPSARQVWLALGGEIIGSERLDPQPLASFAVDSRRVEPGGMFVALPGSRTDGYLFMEDAYRRGATTILTYADIPALPGSRLRLGAPLPAGSLARPYLFLVEDTLAALQKLAAFWRRQFEPRVVAITGSVGKTTTKELTAAVLRQRFRVLKSEQNYNNEIGLPLTLLRLSDEHEVAVLEMGTYGPGEIRALCAIASPQIGVVTNIGPTHLERMGSLERIAAAKAELVEALPADGLAILNGDDPLVAAMADQSAAPVMTYGLEPGNDLWADEIESAGLEGIRFTFHYQGETLPVRIPLLGQHSVQTALRSAAVGLTYGLDWGEIVAGLQDMTAQLRLLAVPGIAGSTIIDDTYNASPASVLAALNLLAELDGRHLAVLGDMLELGDYEEKGHRLVGARAAAVTQWLVAVGRRARWIADEAVAQGMSADRVVRLDSAAEAAAFLRERLQPGDVLLVKGSRAMALERVVNELSEMEES